MKKAFLQITSLTLILLGSWFVVTRENPTVQNFGATGTVKPDYASSTNWVHSFSNEVVNAEPTGFTVVKSSNEFKATTSEKWHGTTSLATRAITGGSTHEWGYFTPSVADGDYQVSGLIRFDDTVVDRAGIIGRAWMNGSTPTGIAVLLRNGNSLRVSSLASSTETVISTVTTPNLMVDQWYWVKADFSSTTIKAKYWPATSTEPSTWAITTTSTTSDSTRKGVGFYAYSGLNNDIYFDHLQAYKRPTLPFPASANDTQKLGNAWASWKEDYVRWDGAVVRPTDLDVVSEGLAYTEQFAVQMNDQATFDLVEGFASSTMERGQSAISTASTLMGYQYTVAAKSGTSSTEYAPDADNDRAVALLWAHARWGSSGAVNYLARARSILGDLRTYTFNTQGGRTIQIPYSSELSKAYPEVNPSYFRPAGFKLFAQYDTTNAAFWNKAYWDGYYMLTEHTDNAGSLPTTAGLPADWMSWSTATTSPGNPLGGGHTTLYGFEAFRLPYAVEWDRRFYSSTSSLAYMTDQIDDFFGNQYQKNGHIDATYAHDGTTPAGYELSYFSGAAYWPLLANGTTTATTLYNAKLAGMYATTTDERAYYASNGYYGGSWGLFFALMKTGTFQNYGQAAATSSPITNQSLKVDGVVNVTGNLQIK